MARSLILVSPVSRVPVELEKDVTVVDFALPSEFEIRAVLDGMLRANASSPRLRIDLDKGGRERLVKAALGLTLLEAENAFARAMVDDGVLDLPTSRWSWRRNGRPYARPACSSSSRPPVASTRSAAWRT